MIYLRVCVCYMFLNHCTPLLSVILVRSFNLLLPVTKSPLICTVYRPKSVVFLSLILYKAHRYRFSPWFPTTLTSLFASWLIFFLLFTFYTINFPWRRKCTFLLNTIFNNEQSMLYPWHVPCRIYFVSDHWCEDNVWQCLQSLILALLVPPFAVRCINNNSCCIRNYII